MLRLQSDDKDFADAFGLFLQTRREAQSDVDEAVGRIIHDVQLRGDEALVELTRGFDHHEITPETLRLSETEIDEACAKADDEVVKALELAHERIWAYHIRQKPEDDSFVDLAGVQLGSRWRAIEAVGLYVPGGTASYPSSVLMNAVPAKVAGAKRIAMVVPTPKGILNPLVLAAARIAGITEIYRIGGAQAIAALAHGTKTIAPVAKITGPGNAYVASAKRQIFGIVGIDMIAGPSEVLVLADNNNDPEWIAADLLAQAEHDISAQSILITDDADFADQVIKALDTQLQTLPRKNIAAKSWLDFGAVILVPDFAQAISLIDAIAPEHLELAINNAEDLMEKVQNAGAIFLGAHTPEAIGDYVAGSNHVLPTGRAARYASGLSVLDFMKRTSILKCTPDALSQIGPAAIVLGEAEGLMGHARSVALRINLKTRK